MFVPLLEITFVGLGEALVSFSALGLAAFEPSRSLYLASTLLALRSVRHKSLDELTWDHFTLLREVSPQPLRQLLSDLSGLLSLLHFYRHASPSPIEFSRSGPLRLKQAVFWLQFQSAVWTLPKGR
jgi:hypothetical protein